jgi:hypothetical protein
MLPSGKAIFAAASSRSGVSCPKIISVSSLATISPSVGFELETEKRRPGAARMGRRKTRSGRQSMQRVSEPPQSFLKFEERPACIEEPWRGGGSFCAGERIARWHFDDLSRNAGSIRFSRSPAARATFD